MNILCRIFGHKYSPEGKSMTGAKYKFKKLVMTDTITTYLCKRFNCNASNVISNTKFEIEDHTVSRNEATEYILRRTQIGKTKRR